LSDQSEPWERFVWVAAGGTRLAAALAVPDGARCLVLFVHGSGSSRFSPRNRFVARALRRRGLATLLLDLLTTAEEAIDLLTGQHRFDVPLLARRVVGAIDWLGGQPETARLRVGCFGSSTGGAAALAAAAERPAVAAVVARGARPDLAADALPRVRAPTLLIVGADDPDVLTLNRAALDELGGPRELAVVPGAGHLFEEPGALEHVADLAGVWLARYLTAEGAPAFV
jgi:dienelactone hydrolase